MRVDQQHDGGSGGRARLRDVARLAGVSTMTVNRVLQQPHKVAPATRARVENVLRETGYTPDLAARGLALRRTGLVGAIVPLLTNALIAEVLQGLTDAIAENGMQLLVGASGFSAQQEESLIMTLLSRRIDALYLMGQMRTPHAIAKLHQARIPIVEGGNLLVHPIDMAVGYSNERAAADMTRHLISLGRGPVGYIGTFIADNDRARDRRKGYEAALREAGIAVAPQRIVEAELTMTGGASAMATLIQRAADTRAVFCSADALAAGALFECQRRAIDVPEVIAIGGFDDLELAGQLVPALTTIRVPRYALGLRAGRMLCDRLAKREVPEPVVDVGYEFVRRASA